MTDQYLASGLRTWLRATEARPDDARRSTDEVMARVDRAGQRGRWWPLSTYARPVSTFPSRELAPAPTPATNGPAPVRRFTMFTAVKPITVAAIAALIGGFLLAGVLTTPDGDPMAPGAATKSSSPTMAAGSPLDVGAFPTGEFVSVENEHLMLEFEEDGTGVKHDLAGRTTSFTYALEGDVYTWLTSDNGNEGPYGQAQYAWDYDGERLAFELLGEDRFTYRKWVYAENTYELMEDPQAVLVAVRDLDVGEAVRAKLGFAPAAEAGPDALTSTWDVRDIVATVPISKGQPITPELLEPTSDEE